MDFMPGKFLSCLSMNGHFSLETIIFCMCTIPKTDMKHQKKTQISANFTCGLQSSEQCLLFDKDGPDANGLEGRNATMRLLSGIICKETCFILKFNVV